MTIKLDPDIKYEVLRELQVVTGQLFHKVGRARREKDEEELALDEAQFCNFCRTYSNVTLAEDYATICHELMAARNYLVDEYSLQIVDRAIQLLQT